MLAWLANAWEHLWAIQASIRQTFRDPRYTLESTTSDLLNGVIDPMWYDFLILNVAALQVPGESSMHIYTYDHRRAFSMDQAGISKVRLRVVLSGPIFDEFVRKADSLGKPNRMQRRISLHMLRFCIRVLHARVQETCILARQDRSKHLARAVDNDDLLRGQDVHTCGCTYTLVAHTR